jgi:hypothetical protein
METPNQYFLSLRLGFHSWYLSGRIMMRGFLHGASFLLIFWLQGEIDDDDDW